MLNALVRSIPPPIPLNKAHLLFAPYLEEPSYLALAETYKVLLIFMLTRPKNAMSLFEFL